MSPRAGLDTRMIVIRAAEIADEQGIEEVTLAALAAKLGVRSPSLYNHVNGLRGIAYTACDSWFRTTLFRHVSSC